MPITSLSNDPFCLKVLQAEEKLSRARSAIKKDAHPMTFSLGRAVGDLLGILGIPPKLFECGKTFRPLSPRRNSDSRTLTGVWSIYQDYKFYNAEGGRKRGHWSLNSAFRDGASQGYQAHSGMLATLGNTMSARDIIEIIDDSESDLNSSDGDDDFPVGVEEWIRNTEASQASMQYFDSEKNKWTTKDNELSDEFFTELRNMAYNEDANGPDMNVDRLIEDTVSNGQQRDTDAGIEGAVAAFSRDPPKEFENLHELLSDVLRMHGEASNSELGANKDTEYEFTWTGM